MPRRRQLLHLLDRLTPFLPAPPTTRPDPSVVPDPDDPRADVATRVARRRLWSHKYRKRGKGGFR